MLSVRKRAREKSSPTRSKGQAPTRRQRLFWQPEFVIKKVLASRCIRTWTWSALPGSAQSLERRFSLLCSRLPPMDRRLPHDGMPVTREHDLVAGFRAAHEIGQMGLGLADWDLHDGPDLSTEGRTPDLVLSKDQIKPPNFGLSPFVDAGSHSRRSGGTASPASASIASSAPIIVWALEPKRRTETVFSVASLRPRAMRTGAFASECSRTL